VLFGGQYMGDELTDTWTLAGTSWTQRTPATTPPTRAIAATAYWPARGEVVVFGGYYGPGDSRGDTWTWNGSTWIQLAPAVSPPPLAGAMVASDTARGEIVLFGGETDGVTHTATWTLNAL
jgi:hypothetical protein